jgi:hypothetical protein
MMKTSLLLLFLLNAHPTFGQIPTLIQDLDLTASVCFLRGEDNGIVNIAEAKVTLDNRQAIVLLGGQAGCLYLRPGAYFFTIGSAYPYAGAGKKWTSPRYEVSVASKDRVLFQVYPKSKGATYTGGWRARMIRSDEK